MVVVLLAVETTSRLTDSKKLAISRLLASAMAESLVSACSVTVSEATKYAAAPTPQPTTRADPTSRAGSFWDIFNLSRPKTINGTPLIAFTANIDWTRRWMFGLRIPLEVINRWCTFLDCLNTGIAGMPFLTF
jgi:hypothetical protein